MGTPRFTRWVAAVWLTCQVTALAAAPFVLCHDHGVMAQMPAKHECGRMCPMHHQGAQQPSDAAHHHHHQSTEPVKDASQAASVTCRCTVSDAALAGITLDAGVVQQTFTLSRERLSTRVVVVNYDAPTRNQLPDTPPPRAST